MSEVEQRDKLRRTGLENGLVVCEMELWDRWNGMPNHLVVILEVLSMCFLSNFKILSSFTLLSGFIKNQTRDGNSSETRSVLTCGEVMFTEWALIWLIKSPANLTKPQKMLFR